jgi:hypothetical protein
MGFSEAGWKVGLPSRYECKYLVSHAVVRDVRSFIAPFMRPDEFARSRDGYRYPICSLYLDTHDLHLYRQTVHGEKNRFKLRVRSYSDEPDDAVFLEVKRRVDQVVVKRRAKLAREDAIAFLNGDRHAGVDRAARELFGDIDLWGARPFLRVKYLREAYEAVDGDSLRVTIDTDVAWLPTLETDLRMGGEGWIPTAVPAPILEIKFTDRYPPWVAGMIRALNLNRESVAKYVLSVDRFFALDGGEGPRVRRAPRRDALRRFAEA